MLQGQAVAGQGQANDLTSMVSVVPTHGSLNPYEKIPVHFKFSPRFVIACRLSMFAYVIAHW
jgi:hypothetical protein